MTYIVNPADPTSPSNIDGATQGAEEFRALKSYIQGLAGLNAGINLFRRNLFSNGDLAVDQRLEGNAINLAVAGTNYYVADRLIANKNTAQTVAVARQGSAIFSPEAFNAVYNTTVAGASAPGEPVVMMFAIPGTAMQNLAFGTAGALPLTLSFKVRSPLAGQHCVAFRNGAANRSYVASYVIDAPNVSQSVAITIPGDITGTWTIDNTTGLYVSWDLGSEATWDAGVENLWTAGSFLRLSTAVKVCETIGIFYLGAIQLEQGNAASPLEILPSYAEKLLANQPYFYKSFAPGIVPVIASGSGAGMLTTNHVAAGALSLYFERVFPVVMRISPVIVPMNPINASLVAYDFTTAFNSGAVTDFASSTVSAILTATANAGSAQGSISGLHITANADFF